MKLKNLGSLTHNRIVMATKVNLGDIVDDSLFVNDRLTIGDLYIVHGKMCVLTAMICSPETKTVYVFRTLDLAEKSSFIHLTDVSSQATKVASYSSIDRNLQYQGKMVCDTVYMYIAVTWWESRSRGSYLFAGDGVSS